ncbi:hypothetical protein P152DRAFT_457803 [Eremomyces bilateralis CBS 781.70]|uniref:Uncharacterized protein n=1 Tax=Eremomyces bilateralis CBS 781.70 TaxID=1392243 RepID=A0A6G1G663_9PEZI|nr:uncharacterized protein P152DRAFT_457803 [Eremomyces bilateralis CBS 781.70]KAF1813441.1 hypothetical protein P152DRAFT_457803 [Eremomyces bilateralis CBS 781.70]
MTKKLGPARDFQDSLDGIFKGCVEALSDSEGWNDFPSFRMLAKSLACLPGLERDAQIALSCQFYIVDKDIREPDKADEDEDETSVTAED